MTPNTPARDIVSSPVTETGMFEISSDDTAHIMNILRDTLYTDKIMAVLREYGSNAWDAHRDSGKKDLPIKVTLPTVMEPALSIRDYGHGLSPAAVFSVFTRYGASTKRTSNESVGMLGIGSKSAFAYADSFTITSWYGSEKRVYVAALDETNKGVLNLLHAEPCPAEETGVEIQLAVRTDDLRLFEEKAKKLFRHFNPQPVINTTLPTEIVATLPSGWLYTEQRSYSFANEWVAVMGCVPYHLDLEQLDDVPAFLRNFHGALRFDIGEVTISASREELKYSDETRAVLQTRLSAIADEYVAHLTKIINAEATSQWDRRLRSRELFYLISTGSNSRAKRNDWSQDDVDLRALHCARVLAANPPPTDGSTPAAEPDVTYDTPLYSRSGDVAYRVAVTRHTRILLRDGPKKAALKGYSLEHCDYLFNGTEAELTTFLDENRMTGLMTGRLSEMPWTAPYRAPSRRSAAKVQHRRKVFRLINWGKKAASDNWEPVDRVPDASDVFVLLEQFTPVDAVDVWPYKKLAEALGTPFPEIYGYKTTTANPVDPKSLTGTEFHVWLPTFKASLATPANTAKAESLVYLENVESDFYWRHYANQEALQLSNERLGPAHPLTLFYQKYLQASENRDTLKLLQSTISIPTATKKKIRTDAHAEIETLLQAYPLLRTQNGGLFAISTHSTATATPSLQDAWINYIQLIDAQNNPAPVQGTPTP